MPRPDNILKRNIKFLKDKENVGASPEKVSEKTREDGKVEETSFSDVFRMLKQPHRLPPKMSENLSVPLALLGNMNIEHWRQNVMF